MGSRIHSLAKALSLNASLQISLIRQKLGASWLSVNLMFGLVARSVASPRGQAGRRHGAGQSFRKIQFGRRKQWHRAGEARTAGPGGRTWPCGTFGRVALLAVVGLLTAGDV